MIPTFETCRASSFIDATITKGTVNISKWTVQDCYNGSDHKTITFSLGGVAAREEKKRDWSDVNREQHISFMKI